MELPGAETLGICVVSLVVVRCALFPVFLEKQEPITVFYGQIRCQTIPAKSRALPVLKPETYSW